MQNKQFEWNDGSKMSFSGWISGEETVFTKESIQICLGLQWKMPPTPMLPSNLYWGYRKCSELGGYICKKNLQGNNLLQNQTITGIEGRLTSPNYPNKYKSNVNYWIKIIAPEKSRIVVQFQKIDIETQENCLFDYVSIQDVAYNNKIGSNPMQQQTHKEEFLKTAYKMLDSQDNLQASVNIKESNNFSISKLRPYIRWCGSYEGDMSKFDFVSKSNEILLNFVTDSTTTGDKYFINTLTT